MLYKYIDTSVLPKNSHGRIKWTANIPMEFHYDKIYGHLTILRRIDNLHFEVKIETNNKIIQGVMSRDAIRSCSLGNLLKDKIIDTDPWMMTYMCDIEDAKKYSHQSNQYIDVKCPYCGIIKQMSISNLYQYGFSCPRCSDGISYPNKFMFDLLTQLKIPFKNEVSKKEEGFDWVQDYRYDFYVEIDEAKYFIEMDGGFHLYEETKNTDMIKDNLAKQHGVNVIRIDCMYHSKNRSDYVKNSILNSVLPDILHFSEEDIDWQSCNAYGINSLMVKVCELWNNSIHSVQTIARVLCISRETVKKYLKEGNEAGMCDYDIQYRRTHVTCNKEINVYKENKFCGTFNSFTELSAVSDELFGVHFVGRLMSECCYHKRDTYKGFSFIFKDEDLNINNTKLL